MIKIVKNNNATAVDIRNIIVKKTNCEIQNIDSSSNGKKSKSKKIIKDADNSDEKQNSIDIIKDIEDTNDNIFHKTLIMELSDEHRIYSQIYVITCIITNKQYVGQANSHKKNNNKYRFHGYLGRFNSHISEAITHTKITGGCTYLNSAIRKYGKESFNVELIMNCSLDDADEFEIKYIAEYNTMSPNGYNLTKGGKGTIGWVNPKEEIDESGRRIPIKRGRDYGYKHKESTKKKMRDYYVMMSNKTYNKLQNTMRNTMSNYHKTQRAEILADVDIDFADDFEKYIRPVYKNNEHINYTIRIKRREYSNLSNKNMSLDDRYQMLYDALAEAYCIQQERRHTNHSDNGNNNKELNDK